MCGRYWLNSSPSELAERFGVDVRDNFPPRYNIAPTQPVALIRQNDMRRREYALARWGFIPGWARKEHLQRMGSKPLINARAETVIEKPTFRSAYKRRRCLIPANGFYEWKPVREGAQAQNKGGGKQPYAISREDMALFAFAGIWETATDPDGGEVDTAAILTCAAGPDVKSVHSREPVVIAPEHYALWLEADERDLAMLADLLAPPPQGTWAMTPVSTAVNSSRHDGPDLIEPLAASGQLFANASR